LQHGARPATVALGIGHQHIATARKRQQHRAGLCGWCQGEQRQYGQRDGAAPSSHREAPFITTSPKVDGTDFYLFRSYEPGRSDFVTLIANYLPLQDAYGGPNYFAMDPNALYEIHVDNNGDAKEDLSFQFRFRNTLAGGGAGVNLMVGGKAVNIPLIQAGAVANPNDAVLQLHETFSVTVVRGDRRAGTAQAVTNVANGGAVFDKPVDNIGMKTIPDYAGYAAKHVYAVNIPGCAVPGRVFVGQRQDPFAVNLGTIFDLVNAPVAVITNPALINAAAQHHRRQERHHAGDGGAPVCLKSGDRVTT
jgi:hypothetical protein